MSKSFIIRPPKWIKNYYTAIFCVSAVGIIVFAILFANKIFSLPVFITLTAVFGVLLFIGVFGTVAYYGEKFYFKDGVYFSQKPFKKAQKAFIKDIALVEIKPCDKPFSTVEILFKSQSGEALIELYTDGWIFRKNIFLMSLQQNRIRTENTAQLG